MSRDKLAAIGALIVAVVTCWASISGALSGGGYEFPTVLALTIALLALGLAIPAFRRNRSTAAAEVAEDDSGGVPWGSVWPGLAIFLGCLLILDKLGFFATSLITFLIFTFIYAPGSRSLPDMAKQAGIGVAFIAVLYVVFVLLLRVQFPKGLLF